MIEGPLLWAIGTGIFTGGVAFGGVKVALNGTRERVKTVEIAVDKNKDANTEAHKELGERLASIETKVDIVVEHLIED